MNWISLLVSTLCGALAFALAALLLYLLVPAAKRHPRLSAAGLVLCGLAGTHLASYYVGPRVQAWYEVRNAENRLLANSVYRVLKKHEPAAYASILADYQRVAGDPSQLAGFTTRAAAQISEVATRRMAQASQQSILELMHDMMDTLRLLARQNDDSCFRYLFPQVGGPADVGRHLSLQQQQHTIELLTEVIRSAAETPQPPPDAQAVRAKLAGVITAVYAEFGADAQMLGRPAAPEVDRAKACAIAISLYEGVLKLPPADASNVFRLMTQG